MIEKFKKIKDSKIFPLIILILIIIVLRIIMVTVIKIQNEEPKNIEYVSLKEGMTISCDYGETTSDITCRININLKDKIEEFEKIEFEYDSNDQIYFSGVYLINSNITYSEKIENKKVSIKTIEKSIKNTKDETLTIHLKFKINIDELQKRNLTFELKNIVLKTKNGPYYKFDDISTEVKVETPNYKIEHNFKDLLIFLKYDEELDSYKEISRYKCEDEDCLNGLYGIELVDLNNGTTFIVDGTTFDTSRGDYYYYRKLIFYDFEKGIIKTFPQIQDIIYLWDSQSLVLTNVNNESILVDKNGEIVKNFLTKKIKTYFDLTYSLVDYSLEDNVIVTAKNGKYGIEKIYSDDIVIEHKYEDIELYTNSHYTARAYVNNKYFRAKENGKWYLYSFDTKEKVIENGYDNFYLVDENIMVAYDNKKLYIKDYKNNNLLEKYITIEQRLVSIHISKNNGIISLFVGDGKDENDYENIKYKKYEFDTKTNKLTEIDDKR